MRSLTGSELHAEVLLKDIDLEDRTFLVRGAAGRLAATVADRPPPPRRPHGRCPSSG
ncbi:MAG: hypothetical protein HY721_18185 [Planctomycetes bacterium]|nr:hypothetical protein [Planctomycetota bacterium]